MYYKGIDRGDYMRGNRFSSKRGRAGAGTDMAKGENPLNPGGSRPGGGLPADRPARVLFLCTGNSCRSQMAEGWARALHAGRIEAHSAGVAPCYVHPLAARVMAEAGVDLSGQYSKHVEELEGIAFDYVVTLCGFAATRCPAFPGNGRRIHRPFPDPVGARGTEEEILRAFREVRDAIRAFVAEMPETLTE